MTDYERALQAGAKPAQMSDYDRALAAGAEPAHGDTAPTMVREPKSFTADDQALGLESAPIEGPRNAQSVGERFHSAGAAVNSAMDRYSFGALGAAARLMGDPGDIAKNVDEYRAANPWLSGFTDAPAYLAEGPAKLLQEGVERRIERVAGKATEKGIGRLARTATSSAATAGVAGGSESGAHGAPLKEVLQEAGKSAEAGAGTGTGLGLLGRAAEGVLGSRGAQAREYIESHGEGAKVSPISAGKGGVFANELKDVPLNDKGIGKAAKLGATDVVSGLESDYAKKTGYENEYRTSVPNYRKQAKVEANDRIQGVRDTAMGPASKELDALDAALEAKVKAPARELRRNADAKAATLPMRDLSDIAMNMRSAAADLETSPATRAKLVERLSALEEYRDPKTERILVPERQVNGLRRSLDRMAGAGQSDVANEASAPLRNAADATREIVQEGPYAEHNKLYAAGMNAHRAVREALGLKKRPPSDRTVDVRKIARLRTGEQATKIRGERDLAVSNFERSRDEILPARKQLGLHESPPTSRRTDVNQVKLALERQGDNTKTAGGAPDLEAFRQAHPDLALATRLPELQRAKSDISFSIIPRHGGLIPRLSHGAAAHTALPLAAYELFHNPARTLVATGLSLGMLNKNPIAARLLYRDALGGRASIPRLSALFAAARAAQGDNQ